MIISLIGSIVLQGVWISNAFKEGEREFAANINDALNDVNKEIDEDEAALFIEERFGGVDSLLNEFIIVSNNPSQEDNIVIIEENPGRTTRSVKFEYKVIDSIRDELEEVNEDIERIQIRTEGLSWQDEYELRLDNLDSLIETTVELEGKSDELHSITNVVHHLTTERLYDGKLAGRIEKTELEEKITSALKKHGIRDSFEYAIMDHGQMDYAYDFMSDNFDPGSSDKEYTKALFQNDRIESGLYELIVQIASEESYIWGKVRPMILLSVLFTVLILICFGYSLYFIFKQKKISAIKNDFINNMTHELKTPLASISLAASSIRHPEVIQKPGEIEHFVDIIESEERRINAHIEQVLDIASLDKGELKLRCVEADLIYLIKDSIQNVDLSLTESNGTNVFDCQLNEAPIFADEFHLTNVFTNILDNSIKYRNDDLRIHIQLIKMGDSYQITIQDNGIGMNSTAQKLAFDKFYRAESGDIHNRKGFGLGLSYVKSIVEAHNGSVSLESEVNKGTTVTIQLPSS